MRCFAWLVGLYACIVRRLKVRKRNPANFLALAAAYCGLSCVCRLGCCGCCAPVLCWLRLCGFGALFGLWVVLLVVFFPFGRYDKKKGRTMLARPLFVLGLWLVICS